MSEVNYVSVQFKGRNYMCIEDSRRAIILTAANEAYSQGEHDIANSLLAEALTAPGCAFEHRDMMPFEHDPANLGLSGVDPRHEILDLEDYLTGGDR